MGDRDLLRLLKERGFPAAEAYKEIISIRRYGPITYYIVDEGDAVVKEFLKRHPEFSHETIVKDLMR